jgi:hypothetical protein
VLHLLRSVLLNPDGRTETRSAIPAEKGYLYGTIGNYTGSIWRITGVGQVEPSVSDKVV